MDFMLKKVPLLVHLNNWHILLQGEPINGAEQHYRISCFCWKEWERNGVIKRLLGG